jgi:hypothetical protein
MKGKDNEGEEDQSIPHTNTHTHIHTQKDSIMKPTQLYLKSGGEMGM